MQRYLRLRGYSRTFAAIVAGCLAVLALAWSITFERIAYERREAEREVVSKNNAFVLAFEEHAARVLQAVDATLKAVRHEHLHENVADLRASMDQLVLLAEEGTVTTLAIVNARGVVEHSIGHAGKVDLSDREFFTTHAANSADVVLVGKPVAGRLSGRPAIPVSRRISGPDGRFRGIVLAGVDPKSFARFYDQVGVGRHGIVQLVGLDGVARVRRVGTAVTWGDDLKRSTMLRVAGQAATGNHVTVGILDRTPRYLSYRRMDEYGLVAAVATSIDESMAGYRARRGNYLAGAAATSVVALLLGALLLFAYARQERVRGESVEAQARYRAAFDHAPVGIAQIGLDGRCLEANREFRVMHDRSEEELRRFRIGDLVHPGDRDEVARLLASAMAESEMRETEARHVRADGSCAWVLLTLAAVRGAEGKAEYLLAMARDITKQKEAAAAAQESQAQFHQLADHIPEAFWISGPGLLEIFYLSPAYDAICGRPFHSMEHAWQEWKKLLHPEDRPRVLEAYCGASDGYLNLEHRIVRPDGEVRWVHMRGFPVPDAQGGIYRIAGTIEDLTAQKVAEEKLHHQAHYDLLTDLPNRRLLDDRMSQALGHARRKGRQLAVLFVDLDRFKAVNETLGHHKGDELLREAARRMSRALRAEDTVARVGGDEFVVLLSEVAAAQDAGKVAEKLLYSLSQPFLLGEHEVYVGGSAGIAMYPSDGADSEALLKNADVAMFRAKQIGRSSFQFYTAEMTARAMHKLLLEGDLRRALDRGEFLLHLQPKARLSDGALTGFEALLRWERPGKGMVSPVEFIPALEDSGLIVPVGEWVLRAACEQVRAWQQAGLRAQPIAVNVSARQFAHHDLYNAVDQALTSSGIHPSLLEIEITETDAMQDPERAIQVVRRLKERGVTVSIDDFGTGYSSLGYLKRFPVDKLKLDRSFVTGLPDDPDDVSIANAVVSMAHSLGLKVVAEGVETEAQRGFLAANGCDQMQGYLLSRPLTAERCSAFLQGQPRIQAVS